MVNTLSIVQLRSQPLTEQCQNKHQNVKTAESPNGNCKSKQFSKLTKYNHAQSHKHKSKTLVVSTNQIYFFVNAKPFSQVTEHYRTIFLELEVTWHVVSTAMHARAQTQTDIISTVYSIHAYSCAIMVKYGKLQKSTISAHLTIQTNRKPSVSHTPDLRLQLSPHIRLTDCVKVLHPTRHKIGHFGDVPQANLLVWCGKTFLMNQSNSE